MKKSIDLNCDVGEGVGNETELMPFISSCNIACGAHAGSMDIVKEVILLANKHHVKIGAHPSYPDRENFGRKVIDMPLDQLESSLIQQILLLEKTTKSLTGNSLQHIKVHGALYNISVTNKAIAQVIVNAVLKTVPNAKLYVPCHSIIEYIALQNKLKVVYEVFADRNYQDNLSLVPRSKKNAVITDVHKLVNHVFNIIENQKVTSISGKQIPIKAETCCVHGDNQKAVEIVKLLHHTLKLKGISIE